MGQANNVLSRGGMGAGRIQNLGKNLVTVLQHSLGKEELRLRRIEAALLLSTSLSCFLFLGLSCPVSYFH